MNFWIELTSNFIYRVWTTKSNGYKSGDKKTVRREGIEPISRVFTYVLFSVTHSLYPNKMVQNWIKMMNKVKILIKQLIDDFTIAPSFFIVNVLYSL